MYGNSFGVLLNWRATRICLRSFDHGSYVGSCSGSLAIVGVMWFSGRLSSGPIGQCLDRFMGCFALMFEGFVQGFGPSLAPGFSSVVLRALGLSRFLQCVR